MKAAPPTMRESVPRRAGRSREGVLYFPKRDRTVQKRRVHRLTDLPTSDLLRRVVRVPLGACACC